MFVLLPKCTFTYLPNIYLRPFKIICFLLELSVFYITRNFEVFYRKQFTSLGKGFLKRHEYQSRKKVVILYIKIIECSENVVFKYLALSFIV